MTAVRLKPALAGPDTPLQRPCRVGDIERKGTERGLDGDSVPNGVCSQYREGRTKRVAARVAQEYPGPAGVPRQEYECADGDGRARGQQEPVVPPPPQAGLDDARN